MHMCVEIHVYGVGACAGVKADAGTGSLAPSLPAVFTEAGPFG